MKVCLDLHDFSIVNSRLDLLYKLKKIYPDFKVSLFTIPVDEKMDYGPYIIRKDLLREVKKLDWIQIVPHGYKHNGSEMMRIDYFHFKNIVLPNIQKAFEDDGLAYIKGFCAPHWRWSEDVVRVLDEMNWWGAVDPRQPQLPRPKRFYEYSHCINEELKGNELKLHGHVYGTKNDLGICMDNLLTLPKDAEWHFVTDFIQCT